MGTQSKNTKNVINEEIWPVALVRGRVKIKIIFWSKLEVLHATETKNVYTWKGVFFNNILHFSIT